MRRAWIILVASGLAACSAVNDPGRHMGGPPPSGDAGAGVDGGAPGGDAGGTGDAGGPRDGGGSTDAGMDAGPGPIEAVDLCDELVAMACEARLRCCASTTQTMDECRVELEPGCTSALEGIAVDARTGYDPAIAREVIEEGRAIAASCDTAILDWYADRDGLMRMFQGTAPEDANCMLSDPGSFWSCRFPMYCVSQALGRACQRPTAESSSCREDLGCETGLFCLRPTLALGECVARRTDGADCARSYMCESLQCTGRMGTCLARSANLYCSITVDG